MGPAEVFAVTPISMISLSHTLIEFGLKFKPRYQDDALFAFTGFRLVPHHSQPRPPLALSDASRDRVPRDAARRRALVIK